MRCAAPWARRHRDVIGHHQHRASRALGRRGAGDRVLDGQACRRLQVQQRGGPSVGVGRRFAPRHFVTAYRRRKVVLANAVQRTLGKCPLGVGNQRHRNSLGGKRFQQFARALAPGQPAVEQLGGVFVQPVLEIAPSRRDRVRDPGRCRRCGWCPPPNHPPSRPEPRDSAGHRGGHRARPGRCPRVSRSRQACHPCRTAPHACPNCVTGATHGEIHDASL